MPHTKQVKQAEGQPSPGSRPGSPQGKRPLNSVPVRYFLLIFFVAILLLGLVLSPFWQLLILAFLLAGIFRPLYSWLSRWISSWTASMLTC
ncbi:MAG TPA: hypothetical protein ENG91_01260, partial [Desulfobacteraceae bacterium]|nr:hypothetical protein [Desulfobacteraceae bacterium]